MKRILFAAVLALAWSAPGRAEDTHETLAEESYKAFNGLADVLAGIKDKDTAEKAKPELKKTGEKIADLKARFEKIGMPTDSKKVELEKKFSPKMKEAMKKVEKEMGRIATMVDGGLDILKDLTAILAPIASSVPKK
jgi:hypothetical protein